MNHSVFGFEAADRVVAAEHGFRSSVAAIVKELLWIDAVGIPSCRRLYDIAVRGRAIRSSAAVTTISSTKCSIGPTKGSRREEADLSDRLCIGHKLRLRGHR